MEFWTQMRGIVPILIVILTFQNGGQVTADKVEEDCGLSYVQLVKGQSLMKQAKKVEYQGPPFCQLVYKSLDTTENIYLIFQNFEMLDCKMRLEAFWGAQVGKTIYNCTNKPEINKPLYKDGQYNITLSIFRVDTAEKDFDIQFEVTTNATVLNHSVAVLSNHFSVLSLLSVAISAIIMSSPWKQ